MQVYFQSHYLNLKDIKSVCGSLIKLVNKQGLGLETIKHGIQGCQLNRLDRYMGLSDGCTSHFCESFDTFIIALHLIFLLNKTNYFY